MVNAWIDLPEFGSKSWKDPVSTATALPTAGNNPGDARVTLDTDTIYIWTGSMWTVNGGSAGVTSLNAATGAINVLPGTNTTVTTSGQNITIGNVTGNLTDVGTDGITITNGTGAVIGAGTQVAQHIADASHSGYLSAADWTTFNNKLSGTSGNYIINPDAEVDTSGWNLYNNAGRTTPAYAVAQNITYTAVASGNAGNGINIEYVFHPTQSYTTPLVTVVSPTLITVAWYNGPTVLNNPSAAQLKAAYDAVPGAVAIATSAVTGSAGQLQYITGSNILGDGGDTSPVDGTGGIVAGVTFTRTLINPIIGVASFDLGKDTVNRQGEGVSTDFTIASLDKGQALQVSFAYKASSGMVLGANSDVQIFIYDITNAILIPVIPLQTLAAPVGTIKTFVGQFTADSTSVLYRLILHVATTSATAWDLELDNFVLNDQVNAAAVTQVQSLVLPSEPISGAVTDHMCVMWTDGAQQWAPATIASVVPAFGTGPAIYGFATNIIGGRADIFRAGLMSGFSFGPFVGYEWYVDNIAGNISPEPSPFTDSWINVGMAVSTTTLAIDFIAHRDLIVNSSSLPIKGGLLTNDASNNGGGDSVLPAGTTGQFLMANSAASLGIAWTTPIATSPVTYSAATHTFALSTVPVADGGTGVSTTSQHFFFAGPSGAAGAPTFRAVVAADIPTLNQNTTGSSASFTGAMVGDVTGTQGGTTISAATVTGKALTGFVSGSGTITAADTILTAFDKVVGNDALKAPLASPTFTGTVNLPAINLINGATNGTNTVLVFKDGHIKSGQTTAPTATVNANAGTGATSTVANATDTAGKLNLTLGSIGTLAAGVQTTLNFNKAFGVAPIVIITPSNAVTATNTAAFGVYVSSTTAGFSINFATAGVATDVLQYNYHVIETQ